MTQLTAEMIVDQLISNDVQVAPGGERLVYSVGSWCKKEEHETSSLWVARIGQAGSARQFTSGETHDRHPLWSPDSKQIAFLSDRAKRGTAHLYVIAADGGEAQALTSTEAKKGINDFLWSPRGGQIALTSADEPTEEDEKREKERDDAKVYGEKWPYARLRLVSLGSREVTTLVSGERHITEFTWHPDGTELAYVVLHTPDLESYAHEVSIERIAIAGGEPHVICRFPCAVRSLAWSQDGSTLFFTASVAKKAQSSQAVYAVPAEGGEPQRIACGETNCAVGLRVLQQTSALAIMLGEGLETRVDLLEPQSGNVVALFDEPGFGYISWDVRQKDDGTYVVAVVRSSGDQPWEVWAGEGQGDGGRIAFHPISSHQEQLAGVTFGKQEPFYWTAHDGQHLDGLLIRPPDAPEQPLPTVVLVHGGPYGRSELYLHLFAQDWGQWLALAGYAVVMPNPRGGFGHGEQFAAAARGAVGLDDYQDVMSAVDAAIERGIADPERLAIGGWSQGGFMSAWAVTQTQRFKAAIMGAGISDWGMMTLTGDVPDFELELGETAPWDGKELRKHLDLSPITFARNVKTPVLILHGENDARVPLSQATGYHRALRRLGVPVEFVVYPREPHGIRERAHQLDLLKRVRSWYDRWLR